MEVRHVVAMSPYQELVSHLARLLYRRNLRPKGLQVAEVLAPCFTNPRTMELVDRCGWTVSNWTSKDQYRLYRDVRMNLRFRYHDYFVTQDGLIIIAVPKKEAETTEGSHASGS